MDQNRQFDFWYAVNNTQLITVPTANLETFGSTIVNYYLICEQMDSVEKICIREGRLKAFKPTIITPDVLGGQVDLANFGKEARKYAEWLKAHANSLYALQYGFTLHKQESKKYVVTDHINNVVDRVKKELALKEDPLSSIIVGVDDPWEVCLIKLMVELVQHSTQGNLKKIQERAFNTRKQFLGQIDQAFLEASRDPSKVSWLASVLKKKGLWDKYEDRFFALVRTLRN